MKIEISPHAKKRMSERGISDELAVETLKNPDEILLDNETGYFIAVKHVGDKILIVAYMLVEDSLKVVSAFLTSKLNIVKNRVKSGKESMKVEYDPEADIMYIKIKEDKIKDTVDLGEDIWADLNEKGEIVGIEIWQARKHIISEVLKYLERAKKVEA